MWDGKRLAATYKDGKAHLNAYLDDYAFLIDAIIHLLSCKWSGKWLEFAMQLADTLLEQFFDNEAGGFFFTSPRPREPCCNGAKDFTDDSLPSGNGTAALALLLLGHLAGRQDYLDAAEKTLKCGWSTLERMPHACTGAADWRYWNTTVPRRVIILRGEEETIARWQQAVAADAGHTLAGICDTDRAEQDLPDLINDKTTDQAGNCVCV